MLAALSESLIQIQPSELILRAAGGSWSFKLFIQVLFWLETSLREHGDFHASEEGGSPQYVTLKTNCV